MTLFFQIDIVGFTRQQPWLSLNCEIAPRTMCDILKKLHHEFESLTLKHFGQAILHEKTQRLWYPWGCFIVDIPRAYWFELKFHWAMGTTFSPMFATLIYGLGFTEMFSDLFGVFRVYIWLI